MSDTEGRISRWSETLSKHLHWWLLGSLTLFALLVAFTVLVLGTNWLADVLPAVFGSLPGFVQKMGVFVSVAAVAILIGRRLFPEVDDAE